MTDRADEQGISLGLLYMMTCADEQGVSLGCCA